MSKIEGQNEAIRIAAAKLAATDLTARAENLGFAFLDRSTISIHAFGFECTVDLKSFEVKKQRTGENVKPDMRILILHYLFCEINPAPAGNLISFRELPGGCFYFESFSSRSASILVSKIKDNLELLKKNLGRFNWKEVRIGDFAAEIQALGKISLTLVYHRKDEEFPPAADILFDASIGKVFTTEDVVVLSSIICRGLL